jgi:imidazolonepropionase-like amidohydrolase
VLNQVYKGPGQVAPGRYYERLRLGTVMAGNKRIVTGIRYIVAGSLIDGSGAGVRRQVFLTVKKGAIAAIGSAADLPGHDGTVIDDFSHCTILPALVDGSVDLARSPSVDGRGRLSSNDGDLAEKAALVQRHSHYCHIHGVLGVADSGDLTGLVELASQGMAGGGLIDIRTSGPLCLAEGSGGNPGFGDFLRVVYSADIENQPDPAPRFSPQDLNRIMRQRDGKKAVVVANGRQAVAEALAAGCDAIEQGYAMGEDNLRKMASRNVLWIPGLLRAKNALDGSRAGGEVSCRFSQRYAAPGKPLPGAEAFWQKIIAEQLAQLSLAGKLGVTTAVGTGAGSVGILHGESMVEELKLFLKAGYTLAEAIRCASVIGAGFFGMERLGPLAVGRPATFLLARGTPQQLPRKLSYLEGIYIEGLPSRAYHKNPIKPAGRPSGAG